MNGKGFIQRLLHQNITTQLQYLVWLQIYVTLNLVVFIYKLANETSGIVEVQSFGNFHALVVVKESNKLTYSTRG